MVNATPFYYLRWTKKDDEQLKRMVHEGADSAEIAKALGRTRAAIFSRKSKLGISTPITPAYGSDMPYVAGKKGSREGVTDTPVIEKGETAPDFSSLVEVLQKAKESGMKVNISISL